MDNEAPSPPFSLRDAEKVVRRLAPALQEHGAWVRRIHSILICRTDPDPSDLLPDGHLRTDFGRWLNEETSEYIRRHPKHAAAVDHYQRTHATARALCQAVSDGEPITPAQYEAFAAMVEQLRGSIEALVKELWDMLRYTDPLTGICTRFAMLPRLKQEHDRVRRTAHPCTICMLDLDHFKRINDTLGHETGDSVLEAVSAYLLRNLRRYDQVCRYGGEEFLLMLPDTAPESAVPVVDRLRRGLAELPIELRDGSRIHVTGSIGIATLAADRSVRDSINDADKAMYEAKKAGRNRVFVW